MAASLIDRIESPHTPESKSVTAHDVLFADSFDSIRRACSLDSTSRDQFQASVGLRLRDNFYYRIDPAQVWY